MDKNVSLTYSIVSYDNKYPCYIKFIGENKEELKKIGNGRTSKGTYVELIPIGTREIVFSSLGGDRNLTVYEVKPFNTPIIKESYNYPTIRKTEIVKPYADVRITYLSYLPQKLYSLDNGVTWLDYTKPFKADTSTKILAKAIDKDGNETEITSYTVNGLTDNMPNEAFDNNKGTSSVISKNSTKSFWLNAVDNSTLRIYATGTVASNSYIKLFDSSNQELASVSLTNNLTTLVIPTGSVKASVYSGSNTLTITEINLRTNVIKDNSPSIEINDVNWSVNKTIDITYPEGYRNEYSLDLGETWIEYLSPITVEKETIVLARVVDNDKVVSSSSFTITKIDTTEPTISLDIPDEIVLKTEYNLPTSYSVDNTKSGGSAICKINDKEVTTTKDLEIGTYEITCTSTTGAGKEVTITKILNVKDEKIDIALELPDRILVGSSNPLPTSVIGSNYSCKVGDTQYQDTKDLEIGTYEITCSVVSVGGNKKEVTKQLEIYEEASTDTDIKDENDEIVGDDTNG